jgi:hypothetical protein
MTIKKEATTVSDDWVDNFFGDDTTTSFSADTYSEKKEEDPEDTTETKKEEEEKDPLSRMKVRDDKGFSMGDIFDTKPKSKKEETEEEDDDDTDSYTDSFLGKEEEEEEDDESDPTSNENPAEVISMFNKLVEDGEIFGFEDGKLETLEDVKALIKANIEEAKVAPTDDEIKNGINAYISNIPEELRIIHDYTARGGQDIKGLLQSLSKVQEVKEIDDSTVEGQKSIVRQHLLDTNFGTPEDIDEQINEWEDLDKLDKKANQYKPMIEKKREKEIQAKIEEQEEIMHQRRAVEKQFVSGIQTALNKDKVGSVTLAKAERDKLLSELTSNRHTSRINQRPLNILGKVLEDITFVKPDYDRLAEITYFAMDREGFLKSIAKETEEKEAGKTMRKLKVTASGDKPKGKPLKYNPINKR